MILATSSQLLLGLESLSEFYTTNLATAQATKISRSKGFMKLILLQN
jgi:hypothetical protein